MLGTINAGAKFRAFPTTTTCETKRLDLIKLSSRCGAMYFPPLVLIRFFLAIGDNQKPVRIDEPDVPGSKPTVRSERLLIIGRTVVIALHHRIAFDKYFAVRFDTEADPVNHRADGADSIALLRVARNRWRGLG